MEGFLQLKKIVHHLRTQLYALGNRVSWVESGVAVSGGSMYVKHVSNGKLYKVTAIGEDGSISLNVEQTGTVL